MKKIIRIFVIILIVAALGSFWGYNKYFRPDPAIRQELTDQFGSDFFNSFNEKTNHQAGESATGEGTSTKGNTAADNTKTQSGSPAVLPADAGNGKDVKPVSQEDIINKYQPQFNYLQNTALSRLDTLYSAAVQEYQQSKKSGTLKRSEIVQKYIQAATMLEGSVDSQFYNTLNAMKSDLIANNLATDIIGQTEAAYEKTKANRRSQLLSKISK